MITRALKKKAKSTNQNKILNLQPTSIIDFPWPLFHGREKEAMATI